MSRKNIGIRKHNLAYSLAVITVILEQNGKTIAEMYNFYAIKTEKQLREIKQLIINKLENGYGLYGKQAYKKSLQTLVIEVFKLTKKDAMYNVKINL